MCKLAEQSTIRFMDNAKATLTAGGETRRDFIKKTATAAAAVAATGILKTPVYGQSTAPSSGRTIGANDRIAVDEPSLPVRGDEPVPVTVVGEPNVGVVRHYRGLDHIGMCRAAGHVNV